MRLIKPLIFFFLLCSLPFISIGQAFQLVDGPISNTASDSRSVNFLDINNDGWEDIYISNGLQGGQSDLLYLNDGTGNLILSNATAITDVATPSDGASFADFNNDGNVDGIISSWYGAPDILYTTDDNGQLQQQNDTGILAGSFAETAVFADYNDDGWLDIYVTNSGGNKKNFLYENNQDGTFTRITDHIIVQDAKLSRGAIFGDFNNDNIQDLFVVNEENTPNDYFIGLGNGAYEKQNSGILVQIYNSSMTNSWGDVDNDGDLDVFVGNSGYFSPKVNKLYLNEGEHNFIDAEATTLEDNNCTFGSAFADFDNDGDLDLAISNGFCASNLENGLYENQGDGTFINVSDLLPETEATCSFGLAWGDINNDGFQDLMIANCKNSTNDEQHVNQLYLNLANENHWIKIKLQAFEYNLNAIGAKIRVKAMINGQAIWQIREVQAQSGYAGQNSMIAHFGLAEATQVDSIIINWPSGEEQILTQVNSNQLLKIQQIPNSIKELTDEINLAFQVFPNPINTDSTQIQLLFKNSDRAKKGKVVLINPIGQVLDLIKLDLPFGESQKIIQLPKTLAKGAYQLVVQLENGSRVHQTIIIQ